jgi:DNA-binding NarL/FixJ family response regulator
MNPALMNFEIMSTDISLLNEQPKTPARPGRGISTARGVERLTPRQREILTLLARGFYYKEIGATLGISHCTVRAHLHSVYQKLEVKSRARGGQISRTISRPRI